MRGLKRQRIARVYFDWLRINPIDRFIVQGSSLRFDDLAVSSGVVDASVARYRYRFERGAWSSTQAPIVPLADAGPARVEIEASHDAGERWSPPARVSLARVEGALQAAELERVTR